eukprot:gene5053-7054_t
MIGTTLKQPEMISIVNNLSGLEQPWNCPHGRPTLRHLFNMNNYYEIIHCDEVNSKEYSGSDGWNLS